MSLQGPPQAFTTLSKDELMQSAFDALPSNLRSKLSNVKIVCTDQLLELPFFSLYKTDITRLAMANFAPEWFDVPRTVRISIPGAMEDPEKFFCIIAIDSQYVIKVNTSEFSYNIEELASSKIKEGLSKTPEMSKHFCVWDRTISITTKHGDIRCGCMRYIPFCLDLAIENHRKFANLFSLQALEMNFEIMGKVLSFFMQVGVYHIDTYPRNIMFGNDNQFIIIDWDHSSIACNATPNVTRQVAEVQFTSMYITLRQYYDVYATHYRKVTRSNAHVTFEGLIAKYLPDIPGVDKLSVAKGIEEKDFMKKRRFFHVEYTEFECSLCSNNGYVASKRRLLWRKVDDKRLTKILDDDVERSDKNMASFYRRTRPASPEY